MNGNMKQFNLIGNENPQYSFMTTRIDIKTVLIDFGTEARPLMMSNDIKTRDLSLKFNVTLLHYEQKKPASDFMAKSTVLKSKYQK